MPQDNFKDQVARKDQQPRAVAANEANVSRARDPSEMMGMGWAHTEETRLQHHEADHYLEPTRKEEPGRPRNTWRRDLEAGSHMEATGRPPLLHKGFTGLSK